jgi:hypothetical protein
MEWEEGEVAGRGGGKTFSDREEKDRHGRPTS